MGIFWGFTVWGGSDLEIFCEFFEDSLGILWRCMIGGC